MTIASLWFPSRVGIVNATLGIDHHRGSKEGSTSRQLSPEKAIYQDLSGCWRSCRRDCRDQTSNGSSSSEITFLKQEELHLENKEQLYSRVILSEECEMSLMPIGWTGLYWDHGEGTGYSGWPLRTVQWMITYYQYEWPSFEEVFSFTVRSERNARPATGVFNVYSSGVVGRDSLKDISLDVSKSSTAYVNNLHSDGKNIAILSMQRSSSTFTAQLFHGLTQNYNFCSEILNPRVIKAAQSHCYVPHIDLSVQRVVQAKEGTLSEKSAKVIQVLESYSATEQEGSIVKIFSGQPSKSVNIISAYPELLTGPRYNYM
tara:strand:+ start:919 stop:1866 length:948 start_codon:yes stop_codon:yes gene_type:complete